MAWFQWQWDTCTINDSIAVKGLFPILLATALYGKHWKGCSIVCRCDNQAVVAVVRSRYAANDRLMHLLQVLFFLEAHHNFHLVAEHIAGNHNTLADHISRNRHSSFLRFLACHLTQHPYHHNCLNFFFYRKTGLHLPGSRCSATL